MNMTTFPSEIKTNKQYTEDNEENQKNSKSCKVGACFACFNGTIWYDINPVMEKALEYYQEVLKLCKTKKYAPYKAAILGNIDNVYQAKVELKRFKYALTKPMK